MFIHIAKFFHPSIAISWGEAINLDRTFEGGLFARSKEKCNMSQIAFKSAIARV